MNVGLLSGVYSKSECRHMDSSGRPSKLLETPGGALGKRRRIMQAWGLFCDNDAWKRLAQLPRDVEAEVIDIERRRPGIGA